MGNHISRHVLKNDWPGPEIKALRIKIPKYREIICQSVICKYEDCTGWCNNLSKLKLC
jgi:hypothetical protein